MKKTIAVPRNRRGAILVLGMMLLVGVFAFVALTVDVGYMAVVKTQLQGAADAAALGSAQEIPFGSSAVTASAQNLAGRNKAAGQAVALHSSDVELGFYDFAAKQFVVSPSSANAVRITTRVQDQALFFAPIMGTDKFNQQATSIGMLNPRDIVFVVDLSGSMNDDTEPCWATDAVGAKYAPLGYPNVATDLMQKVYSDFGFGTFPGSLQYLGAPLGVPDDYYAYAEMTKDSGPLTRTGIPAAYRIDNADSEDIRKQKAYAWIIDYQIATIMPNATPTPDSSTNYSYWSTYIDYIVAGTYVGEPPPPSGGGGSGGGGGGGGPTPPPATGWLDHHAPDLMSTGVAIAGLGLRLTDVFSALAGLTAAPAPTMFSYPGCPRRGGYNYTWLPSPFDSDRISKFNNPNTSSFPTAAVPWAWANWIGYQTYVQFMMDWGRERSPEIDNGSNANPMLTGKTPLSVLSPLCAYHSEVTAGGTFNFPPRSEPMHSLRRALIAGIDLIKQRNTLMSSGAGDRVSIVTFDGNSTWHGPRVVQPLTDDFDAAMLVCTRLQAASDIGATTSTDSGVAMARLHLLPKDATSNPTNDPKGPQGRRFTSKVVVLVTDGMPNVWDMSTATIDNYISAHSSFEYYPSGYDWFNSVLVHTHQFHKKQRGQFHGVGMGLGTDYDFMDRIARIGSTAINGESVRGSGNPAEYEQQLIDILGTIINRPGSRLVE